MAVALLSLTLPSFFGNRGWEKCTRDACRAADISLRAGISPALGTQRPPARAGTSSHHALQPTAIAIAWVLATAWLNLTAWQLSCFLPGNKIQLAYLK